MIFRRIMLVLLPLLAVGFVFTVMWYLYQDWERSLVGRCQPDVRRDADVPTGVVEMETVGQLSHGISTDVNLARRNEAGRLELRFLADRIEHLEKKTADIERPAIQFFTHRNEIITLLADRARLVTRGPLMVAEDIESGRLWGNVVLVHDRGTPDDYADDIIASLDEVTFDNETYEMATDRPVILAGGEMTLTATGMRMVLDRQTRRVIAMAFPKDIMITFEAGDQMTVSLTAPEPPAGPTEAPPTSPAPPTAVGGPTPADASTPADTRPAEAGTAGELWHIDLQGEVFARQGDQRLRCDRLTLYNRTAAGQMPGTPAAPDKPEPPEPRAPLPPASAAPPAQGPAAPATGFDKPSPPQDPADMKPLMTVIADGPLVITPVPEADRVGLGNASREVTATGTPVVVEDGQTRITGASVRYNTKTGSGTVAGQDGPMQMEQPGRMFLTGDRLDFNRTAATAEVAGAGRLRAMVQAAGLTGPAPKKASPEAAAPLAEGAPAEDIAAPDAAAPPTEGAATTDAAAPGAAAPPDEAAPPAEAAPPGPKEEPLEASWTRGMRLAFYRLPASASEGMGEIKQAQFHGRAAVQQGDGVLKGEDLAIDFAPAEKDRGQSVSRLVGHGNVLLKNAPVGGTGVTPGADAGQANDIACRDLDIRFARDPATGDTQPAQLDASGDVAINDPKGKIRAQQLAVTFGRNDEGETEARFLDARGGVLIDREDLQAEGEHVRRDTDAGLLVMEGSPARARRNGSRIVGPAIRFSQNEGRATVTGAGELEVPATTDLRGRPRDTPEPLLVRWTKDMFFSDRQNFARFNGSAAAITGGTELACERLWVHFADAPPEPPPPAAEPAAVGAPAASSAPPATPAPAADAPAPTAPGEASGAEAGSPAEPEKKRDDALQRLFGRKRLVRMLAEENVNAVDQRLEEGEAIRHRMEISGENLTYLEESRKAYMHGPGRLRILTRDRAGPDPDQPPPLTPKSAGRSWDGDPPPAYARTQVAWTDSMAFDGLGNRAYFQGGVEATHTGRGVPGEGAADTRRSPTSTRITSRDLQVVFAERKPEPAAGTAAAPLPVVGPAPAAETPSAPKPPLEDRMSVEKLIASGGVLLWVDDRRGEAERLIYQRDPELIRLYRGAEPNAWARLWRQNEATQEFGEIAARTITYDPATGRVDVVDQQVITISPQPTPVPKPAPRLVPGPRG